MFSDGECQELRTRIVVGFQGIDSVRYQFPDAAAEDVAQDCHRLKGLITLFEISAS